MPLRDRFRQRYDGLATEIDQTSPFALKTAYYEHFNDRLLAELAFLMLGGAPAQLPAALKLVLEKHPDIEPGMSVLLLRDWKVLLLEWRESGQLF